MSRFSNPQIIKRILVSFVILFFLGSVFSLLSSQISSSRRKLESRIGKIEGDISFMSTVRYINQAVYHADTDATDELFSNFFGSRLEKETFPIVAFAVYDSEDKDLDAFFSKSKVSSGAVLYNLQTNDIRSPFLIPEQDHLYMPKKIELSPKAYIVAIVCVEKIKRDILGLTSFYRKIDGSLGYNFSFLACAKDIRGELFLLLFFCFFSIFLVVKSADFAGKKLEEEKNARYLSLLMDTQRILRFVNPRILAACSISLPRSLKAQLICTYQLLQDIIHRDCVVKPKFTDTIEIFPALCKKLASEIQDFSEEKVSVKVYLRHKNRFVFDPNKTERVLRSLLLNLYISLPEDVKESEFWIETRDKKDKVLFVVGSKNQNAIDLEKNGIGLAASKKVLEACKSKLHYPKNGNVLEFTFLL
jgi:hypothetical protein